MRNHPQERVESHTVPLQIAGTLFPQIVWDIAEVVTASSLHRTSEGAVGQRVHVSVLQILEEIV